VPVSGIANSIRFSASLISSSFADGLRFFATANFGMGTGGESTVAKNTNRISRTGFQRSSVIVHAIGWLIGD
jgi:hypothetical protein